MLMYKLTIFEKGKPTRVALFESKDDAVALSFALRPIESSLHRSTWDTEVADWPFPFMCDE